MRMLSDYHHSDLFESLQLTFQDRFGWEVFRPIGMEWFNEDYWQFEKSFHGDAVAKQYLGFWDKDQLTIDGYYERADWTHPGRIHKMVTLEQARQMEWDVVLASVPANEPGLSSFAREHRAHFGVQMGNHLQVPPTNAEFVLVSTELPYTISVPHVVYRQEFSMEDFRYEPPPRDQSIASFIQCLPENTAQYNAFLTMARHVPEWKWGIYGSYGSFQGHDEFERGNLPTTPAVAEHMRAVDAIWHTKHWSDGYGHVIHNAFAVGRPVIGDASYYVGKLAGPLWVDGITSIDVGKRTYNEVKAELLRMAADEDYHRGFCNAAAARFREIVNFDEDAIKVKALMEQVL